MSEVLVLGAGVIGLSSAIQSLRAGHRVRVWARESWERTTSAVSAAVWFPYQAEPRARVLPWAQQSYAAFQALATVAESGVTMSEALIVIRPETSEPWWRQLLPSWRAAPTHELPAGAVAGDLVHLPIAEMPIYLPFLVREARALGANFERHEVASLEPALAQARVIVNCTGLGAREVARDTSVFPIRGQVVSVAKLATRCVLDDDNPGGVTYIVPRSQDCVLGGTCEPNVESLAADAAQSRAIRARCAALAPELAHANEREVRVGLRPGRSEVRLETERLGDRRVVHNYGHGGSGMTLSWGCAEEVVALLAES